MAHTTPQVAVIGAGPCGLITSLLLARFGVPALLVEKHRGISRHPKAMGITRRTAEIYRQLGLLEAMRAGAMARPADYLSLWSRDGLTGELLGGVPFAAEREAFSPCHPFHCPQTHTEAVLLEAVRGEALIDCRFSTTMTAFQQEDGGVTLSLEGAEGGTASLTVPYLVAADGDRSGIREQLGITRHGPGTMGRFLSVYFRAAYGERLRGRLGLLMNTLGADFFAAFVAVNGDDLWLMHHVLGPGETPQDYSPEQLAALVQRASGMPELAVEVLSVSPWSMTPSVAECWRQGRVLLVGDAAARVSPAGGLGMNNGIQSAHNLAWKLAAVLQGRAADSLLDSYQEERLAAARFTFENSQGNAQELFAIVQAGLGGDWDGARQMIASSRRAGSGYGQDFGIVYASGAIEPDGTAPQWPADQLNDYIPQARPGHRAPHCWLQRDGERISSLDLFGREPVLLCAAQAATGAPAPWRARWSEAAAVLREGVDFSDLQPAGAPGWQELYGIGPGGAVLVRPDGYVAARRAA